MVYYQGNGILMIDVFSISFLLGVVIGWLLVFVLIRSFFERFRFYTMECEGFKSLKINGLRGIACLYAIAAVPRPIGIPRIDSHRKKM